MNSHAQTSDRDLIAEVVRGDAAAFGELYDRHAQDIYRFLVRNTGNPDEAEDLLSVVFLEAWRAHARTIAVDESFRPWLFGIAGNVVRSRWRSLRRHAAALERFAAEQETVSRDRSDDVVARVDAEVGASRVAGLLTRLPKRERRVAELCLLHELSMAAAAQALGIPEGTVKSRLASARGRLGRLLQTSEQSNPVPTADMNSLRGQTALRPKAGMQ